MMNPTTRRARCRQLLAAILVALSSAGAARAQAPAPASSLVQQTRPTPTQILPRGYRIIVRDRVSNLDAIENILENHDKAPREVRVESYVLQVSQSQNKSNGIDLDFFFGGTKEDLPLGAFSTNQQMRAQGANQQFRFGSLSTEKFTLFLDFLKRNTNTKVLSRPMLTVLDGQQATINIGQQIPFVTQTVSPGLPGQQALQGSSVQFASVGINLQFTPTILPNDIVRMQIAPEISDVDGQASANAPPPTRSSRVSTTMFVKDRHAFLIGGLYRVDTNDRAARLPLLGNLPIIGDYFGEKTSTKNRNEVVIVVKPTITSEQDFEDTPDKG